MAMPSHKKIVLAQRNRLAKRVKFEGLSDIELEKFCWACSCGSYEHNLTRAHIVARTHGGPESPDNFFLLCDGCHSDQPDGASAELQWSWLFQHESWANPSLWRRRYPKSMSVIEVILPRLLRCGIQIPSERMKEIMKEAFNAKSAGWSNARPNIDMAMYGLFKSEISKIRDEVRRQQ